MNRQFRKYLGYAVGEIVLVIAGIVIALRIDTWHEERQTQKALDEYLASIARNIRDDIDEIQTLRGKRESAMFAAKVARWNMGWLSSYSIAEIDFASDALALAREQLYFNANTSGYEGLRNSGLLSSLDNPALESLLFEYYEIVSRIRQFEQSHNDYLRGLSLQFTSHTHGDLIIGFREPEFLADQGFAGEEIQAGLRRVMTDPVVLAWYESTELQSLLGDYERLKTLGNRYIDWLRHGPDQRGQSLPTTPLYDPNGDDGYAHILENGRLALHFLDIDWFPNPDTTNTANSGTFSMDINAVRFSGDRLDFAYPGVAHLGGPEWAAFAIRVAGPSPSVTRQSRDYSGFARLRLEMKGDKGGETFSVHLKDSEDPDDGSQTDIPVTLTDEWENHEFDLSAFENADLSKLYIVTGFLFYQQPEPASFSVRNITFLKPGDP